MDEEIISLGDIEPKKHLSQNFLIAPEFTEAVAQAVPGSSKKVLEIGAGTGLITKELAKRGFSLTAIELDESLFVKLRKDFESTKSVKIVFGDALAQSFKGFDCIVGALPYHLSSELLFKALEAGPKAVVVVVQKEFGMRMCAEPGSSDWSRLSVMVQKDYAASVVDLIPANCFYPAPKVDSVIVLLEQKPASKRITLSPQLVNAVFQHKNQSVRKALLHSEQALGLDKTQIKRFLENAPGEIVSKRARVLSLEELSALSRLLK